MSGIKALFDSNALIYASQGKLDLSTYLHHYSHWGISLITYMEVLGYPFQNSDEEKLIREILQSFEILPITQTIADQVIQLRKRIKIKLPDAIIWATAYTEQHDLITYNAKDFSKLEPTITVVVPDLG
ncbi:MAG: PIN domain-containing protein [Candidatus Sericytochromatia bacterium]|nr:PIN domain-containing protein [Candidatus Sericytochromatia bacterium]